MVCGTINHNDRRPRRMSSYIEFVEFSEADNSGSIHPLFALKRRSIIAIEDAGLNTYQVIKE